MHQYINTCKNLNHNPIKLYTCKYTKIYTYIFLTILETKTFEKVSKVNIPASITKTHDIILIPKPNFFLEKDIKAKQIYLIKCPIVQFHFNNVCA